MKYSIFIVLSIFIICSLNACKNRKETYQEELIGKYVLEGAKYAGFTFSNSNVVLWTNEMFNNDPDTLSIYWVNDSTFITKSIELRNKDCPPSTGVYIIKHFDEKVLILNEIWTGWGDFTEEESIYYKK